MVSITKECVLKEKQMKWMKICLSPILPSPLLLPHLESFSSSRHRSPPLALPVSFGGRYYVIAGGIEHRSRGSSGPMNY